MHMAVDGLEEKELGGSSYYFDDLLQKQQLITTSDESIGTTRRGTIPPYLYSGLFILATFALAITPTDEEHGERFYRRNGF